MIVNETLAKLVLDGPDVIGLMMGYPGALASLQIVGVVRDSRNRLKAPASPTLFLSANRVLRSLLFEISPDDPTTIVLAVAALTAVGVLAGLIPARRAARVDPAVTLGCE